MGPILSESQDSYANKVHSEKEPNLEISLWAVLLRFENIYDNGLLNEIGDYTANLSISTRLRYESFIVGKFKCKIIILKHSLKN